MAPFKKLQRVSCVAAIGLLLVFVVDGWAPSEYAMPFTVGYVAYMLLDLVVYCGDTYLAERLGYRCRNCGLQYSLGGMISPTATDKTEGAA